MTGGRARQRVETRHPECLAPRRHGAERRIWRTLASNKPTICIRTSWPGFSEAEAATSRVMGWPSETVARRSPAFLTHYSS